jgi:hypothetical protein
MKRNLRKKILIYAAPFSYGPTGKALSLASHLKDYYDIDFSGYNTSWELIALDSLSVSNKSKPILGNNLDDQTILNYSLIISCSDLNLALRAKSLDVKSVMFDSVFWWRSPKIEDIYSIDAYIVQDFLGVDQAIDALGKKPSNFHKVGAVFRKNISQVEKASGSTKRILINYGGIESPYIQVPQNSRYPFIMTDILSPLFKDKSDFEFIVTGKNHVMKKLANQYNKYCNVKFKTLDHNAFLSCIGRSDLVITTPGIETFYETVYLGKHSVLLLPHNSTQYLQLMALIDAGIESPVCHYNYYGKNCTYKRNLDESKEVNAVINDLNEFYSFHQSLNNYQHNFYTLIKRRLIEADIYENKKQQYLKNIGTNGSQSIIEIVGRLIN